MAHISFISSTFFRIFVSYQVQISANGLIYGQSTIFRMPISIKYPKNAEKCTTANIVSLSILEKCVKMY